MNVLGHALAGEYTSQIGLADTYCSAVSSDPRIKSFRLIGQSGIGLRSNRRWPRVRDGL